MSGRAAVSGKFRIRLPDAETGISPLELVVDLKICAGQGHISPQQWQASSRGLKCDERPASQATRDQWAGGSTVFILSRDDVVKRRRAPYPAARCGN